MKKFFAVFGIIGILLLGIVVGVQRINFNFPLTLGPNATYATAGVNINAQTEATGAATCNWSISPYCRVTLASATLSTLTLSNPVDGAQYILEFVQPSSSTQSVTLPASVVGAGGNAAPSITTAASAHEYLTLVYNTATTNYTVTDVVSSLGNVLNNCKVFGTLSSGVLATTLPACFANVSDISVVVFGGSPTAGVPTPTAVAGNIQCAQPAAKATSVNCNSSSSADARVIAIYGVD